MASRTFTQQTSNACFYPQYSSNYNLQCPADAFVNIDKVVFSPEIESNFQKASKKIGKSGQESKKINRKKHNRARNPWTPQEDAKLIELMKKHGQSWAMISASMEGRTGKQIRDRFLNKLRPNIKCGDWSVEEDELMIRLLNEIGNRWSLIATHLPGRTEGQVKNRYYSSIKKRLESNGALSHTSASLSEVQSSFPTSPEAEEPKLDFGFDFDASVMNNAVFHPESVMKNNTMISKGPYAFEEDTNSDETTTQDPISQSETPFRITDPASYNFTDNFFFSQPESSDAFFLPTIENDNQIDDVLGNVANYFLDNSSVSSDVDSYFADDLKSQKKNSQADAETDKLALLSRRKALLELALAKTLKEIKSL